MHHFFEFLKKVLYRYTNVLNPSYDLKIEPVAIYEILKQIDEKSRNSDVLYIMEAGCARGDTSRFICEFIKNKKIKAQYYCIDTFSSFTNHSIKYEVENRGKSYDDFNLFKYVSYEKFKKTFKDIEFVKVIKADVGQLDLRSLPHFDIILLDVDLYEPSKAFLEKIITSYNHSCIILVDDVKANTIYDGAYQAFNEIKSNKIAQKITIGQKTGIIYLSDK